MRITELLTAAAVAAVSVSGAAGSEVHFAPLQRAATDDAVLSGHAPHTMTAEEDEAFEEVVSDEDGEDLLVSFTRTSAPSLDSEYLAQSVCYAGMAGGNMAHHGAELSLMQVKYQKGMELHKQCSNAYSPGWYACGVAKGYYQTSNCPWWWTIEYPYPDQRKEVPKKAKGSYSLSFTVAREFENHLGRYPNCNTRNTVICCSTECKGW